MKVYLSGPMTGYPNENRPAFHERAAVWRKRGWEVFSPAEDEVLGPYSPAKRPVFLKWDIQGILDSEAVCVLPGWDKAAGAQMEVYVARSLRYPIYDALTFSRIPEEDLQSLHLAFEVERLEKLKVAA